MFHHADDYPNEWYESHIMWNALGFFFLTHKVIFIILVTLTLKFAFFVYLAINILLMAILNVFLGGANSIANARQNRCLPFLYELTHTIHGSNHHQEC